MSKMSRAPHASPPSLAVLPLPLVLAMLIALVALVGCKKADSYAQTHANQIRLDCVQTVGCQAASGTTLDNTDIDKCVAASGDILTKASSSQRAAFEAAVSRCSSMQACAYVSCTTTNSAYSTAHMLDIMYDCQQSVACMLMNGASLPLTASGDCAKQLAMKLDAAQPLDRTVFETHFANCHAATSCAYVNCR